MKRRHFWVVLLAVCLGVTVWQRGSPNLQAAGERSFAGLASSPPAVPDTANLPASYWDLWKVPPNFIPNWNGVPQELRATPKTITPPPAEPVRWTAEFEPMHGTLMAWPLDWRDVQDAFCAMVDELQDVGVVYMLYDTQNEKSQIIEKLKAAGVSLENVLWVTFPKLFVKNLFIYDNCNWTRDYGPENVFGLNSGAWGIVDNRYILAPKENGANAKLNRELQANYFETPLITEGGNLCSDGMGRVFCTTWIVEENFFMSEAQLRQIFRDYYGAELVIMPQPPVSPHIDMCSKLVGPETWIVGEWPADDPNTPLVEEFVSSLQGMLASTGNPYTIHRIRQPARLRNGYWRTYTNAYQHNGKVLVPTFNVPEDVDALAVYQQALPGWEIIGIDCSGFDGSGGAIHCSAHEIAGEGAAQLLNGW